jgi:hypothetical protein
VRLHPYSQPYRKTGFKPMTHVLVDFLGCELPGEIRWPALLDTGSPYTILPGRVNGVQTHASENAMVEVMHGMLDWRLSQHDKSVLVPIRGGASAKFGGVGAPATEHVGFMAHLEIPGLFDGFEVVYFDEVDHAVIGTSVLLDRDGTEFRRAGYRCV